MSKPPPRITSAYRVISVYSNGETVRTFHPASARRRCAPGSTRLEERQRESVHGPRPCELRLTCADSTLHRLHTPHYTDFTEHTSHTVLTRHPQAQRLNLQVTANFVLYLYLAPSAALSPPLRSSLTTGCSQAASHSQPVSPSLTTDSARLRSWCMALRKSTRQTCYGTTASDETRGRCHSVGRRAGRLVLRLPRSEARRGSFSLGTARAGAG